MTQQLVYMDGHVCDKTVEPLRDMYADKYVLHIHWLSKTPDGYIMKGLPLVPNVSQGPFYFWSKVA